MDLTPQQKSKLLYAVCGREVLDRLATERAARQARVDANGERRIQPTAAERRVSNC